MTFIAINGLHVNGLLYVNVTFPWPGRGWIDDICSSNSSHAIRIHICQRSALASAETYNGCEKHLITFNYGCGRISSGIDTLGCSPIQLSFNLLTLSCWFLSAASLFSLFCSTVRISIELTAPRLSPSPLPPQTSHRFYQVHSQISVASLHMAHPSGGAWRKFNVLPYLSRQNEQGVYLRAEADRVHPHITLYFSSTPCGDTVALSCPICFKYKGKQHMLAHTPHSTCDKKRVNLTWQTG